MKLALVLNAINPAIGGVLIRGEKGTAKSTAVRALARLLPDQDVVEGCLFGCHPEDRDALCTDCQERLASGEDPLPRSRRRMRVVELPINASEDRVVGTIDLEAALREGSRRFEPGVLAEANRNILYVDEVNLLDDHIVDVLLDAAAMGVNVVEREGVSVVHPARFILVGTMNPEEGELRPQLLDRFGLCVDVEGIRDPDERIEIAERDAAFRSGDETFNERFLQADQELAGSLSAAIAAGRVVECTRTPTFVDGIGARTMLVEMWPPARRLLAGSLVVSLEDVAAAIRMLVERAAVVGEGAAGAAVAAGLKGLGGAGQVVCVVSGGNIEPSVLSTILAGGVPT